MIPVSPSIGIGITTKNRWNDLAVTLTHLRDEGLDQLETIVFDDGSDQPMPADFVTRFPWVKFERFEQSGGYIVRRNHLARQLSTDFYLSLDDDSFPVAGDLAAAAAWLKDHPGASALAFRIIRANDEVPDVSKAGPPVQSNSFIGCGFMLRRDLFLSLGGFEERLKFYHEEPEYSFRAFQAGYSCYGYPAIVIRHMVSPAARMHSIRTRYFIRNIILMDLWFYSKPLSFVRAIGHLPLLFRGLPRLRQHPFALLRGWLEGFVCYFAWGEIKKPLTHEQLAIWKSRPNGHKATNSKFTI